MLQVFHRMSSPSGIIYILEAQSCIESLSLRITFIYKQTYRRDTQITATSNRSLQQFGSDALASKVARHSKAVDIEFPLLGLIHHPSVINAKSIFRRLIKTATKLSKLSPIIRHTYTSKNTTRRISNQGITITVLAIFHLHQTLHHTMEIRQSMFRSGKVLTTLSVHRLHNERCYMGSQIWRSIFYLYLHNVCKDTTKS